MYLRRRGHRPGSASEGVARAPPLRHSCPLHAHMHALSHDLQDRDAELPVPRVRGPREDREERAPRPAGGRTAAPRAPAGAGSSAQRLEAGPPGTTLYVGNLPWSADWKAVKDIFRLTGYVLVHTRACTALLALPFMCRHTS